MNFEKAYDIMGYIVTQSLALRLKLSFFMGKQEKNKYVLREEEVLEFWQKNKIFEKSIEKEAPKGDYIFYEGPPTANGKPGIHHVLARVFKDFFPRYKTMQGYRVPRKAGWDTHGLPVELQVEKELGLKNKKEVEEYGVAEFNKKCRESVWRYKEDWEKLTRRMGFWLDMDNAYITYENYYIESVWNILKEIWDKDLLYLGHKVVPYCARCGTPLSSHEVAQGYQNIEEDSVYLKFKVTKGNDKVREGDFILSWTTTPWTLPGNVALAVGKDVEYVRFNYDRVIDGKVVQEYYISSKEYFEQVQGDYKIDSNVSGGETPVIPQAKKVDAKDLVGIEYEPLFPGSIDPGDKKAWYVTTADFVTTEDGTGVVHTAVMYGVEDYELGEEIGLPKVHTVDETGKFNENVEKWKGKFVKDVEKEITEDLKQRDLLFKVQPYRHDYPFCWRCDTPLLYYAKDSWFIEMTAVRDQLIKNNEEINWVPSYIKKGRFGEWLDGVKDWALSRERYWGTPLPIWQCSNDHKVIIGGKEDLQKQKDLRIEAGSLEDLELHRPYVDQVYFKCPECGEEMSRVKDLIDVWFDSGSMPFAQWGYPYLENSSEKLENSYPAEYISEAVDQTRGWFYTLLAISTLLDKGTCYKNCICLGHIRDAKGQKMSKSKGNVIDPWEVINKYGIDALRWYLYTMNQPGEPKNYDFKYQEEVFRKVIMLLDNIYGFYNLYSSQLSTVNCQLSTVNVLDKWILARLNVLIKNATERLEQYDIIGAGRPIQDFIDELSTWYLRRSRDRFKGDDEKDKEAALATTRYVLLMLSKLLAPFMPFIAEDLYQKLGRPEEESVHLCKWPKADEKLIDEKLLESMEVGRKVVEVGLAARDVAGMKVRQPLVSFETAASGDTFSPDIITLITDELNVKELKFGNEDKLDTKLTLDLKQEGMVRELVRFINALRKQAGLTINDNVKVYYQTDGQEVLEVFDKFSEEIKRGTLSTELIDAKYESEDEMQKTVKVDEQEVWLGLEKM